MSSDPLKDYASRHGEELSELERVDLTVIDGQSQTARTVFSRFVDAARSGSPFAMTTCACLYREGWGTRPDPISSFEWAERASAHNYPPGIFELGRSYEEGFGVAADVHRAIALYELSATKGYAPAAFLLAIKYQKGIQVAQNVQLAMQYAQLAFDLGDAFAAFQVGVWYENGEGVTMSATEALKWFKRAAEAGSTFACTRLGVAYSCGELGLTRDDKEARRWFELADPTFCP